MLHRLGPPDVASAGRPQPPVPQTPAPAIVPDPTTPGAQSGAPAIDEARAGATAANQGNSKDPQTATASLPTAPQPHTASSPIPESPLSAGPIGALPQVAIGNPAASSAVPESRAEEDRTNAGGIQPVGRKRVAIHYLVGSSVSDAAAKRLSTRLGVQPEMREVATVPRSALVRYASSDDHATAREAGKVLGEMGYAWKIEIAPNRPDASSLRYGSRPGSGLLTFSVLPRPAMAV